MSIIGRALSFFGRKAAPGRDADGFIMGYGGDDATIPSYALNVTDPARFSQLELRYFGWAYVCATRNAQSVADCPPKLYRPVSSREAKALGIGKAAAGRLKAVSQANTDDLAEVLSHPSLDLLADPNPEQDGSDLLLCISLDLEICGNAYLAPAVEGDNYEDGEPFELWALEPAQVRYVEDTTPNRPRIVLRWDYGYGVGITKYPASGLCHFAFPGPHDPIYGYSPMQAALGAINIDLMAEGHEASLLRNRARPDLFVKVPPNTQGPTIEALRDQWNSIYRGPNRGGKVGVGYIEDIVKLGMTAQEMAMPERVAWNRQVIAGVFGVPMSMLTFEGANRASADAGLYQYAKYTIAPRLKRRNAKLTHWLLPRYEGTEGWFFGSDNPVPADEAAQLETEVSHVTARIRTPNEIRAAHGWEPIEGGDEFPAPPQVAFNAPPVKGVKSAGEVVQSDRLVNALQQYFREQMQETIAAVVSGKRLTPYVVGTKAAGDIPDGWLFDKEEWDAKLSEKVGSLIAEVTLTQANTTGAAMGVAVDLTNEDAKTMAKRTIERLASRVNAESAARLTKLFEAAIEEGVSTAEIASRLTETFETWIDGEDLTDSRASVIARTETARAQSAGSAYAYKEAGVERLQWDAAGDSCEFCRAMNGRSVGIDDNFVASGDSVTGIFGGSMEANYGAVDYPPLHPNCRCVVVPVV